MGTNFRLKKFDPKCSNIIASLQACVREASFPVLSILAAQGASIEISRSKPSLVKGASPDPLPYGPYIPHRASHLITTVYNTKVSQS